MPKATATSPIEKFISRFKAKEDAASHEYLLMITEHYYSILSPARARFANERSVILQLPR
jgi:hypothetical protein